MLPDIADELGPSLGDVVERSDFSGAIAVWDADGRRATLSAGLAHRGHHLAVTAATRFATASATKGITALAVASLVDDGALTLDTTLRSIVGERLTSVDDRVTIEHLLGHTSGVGDYLDESIDRDIDDHVVSVPVHLLESPPDYLRVIDGFPQAFEPGARFAYNNGGYVMLSVAAELVTGRSFYDLVTERVTEPAGMDDSGFFRSDELDGDVALGYLKNGRSNVFHLPVRGAGDGGIYSTIGDVERFWRALFAGDIVAPDLVRLLTTARSDAPDQGMRYGLGFWLAADGPSVVLEGMDAGVSFRSSHDPTTGAGYVVMSNTSSGAWPVARHLEGIGEA